MKFAIALIVVFAALLAAARSTPQVCGPSSRRGPTIGEVILIYGCSR